MKIRSLFICTAVLFAAFAVVPTAEAAFTYGTADAIGNSTIEVLPGSGPFTIQVYLYEETTTVLEDNFGLQNLVVDVNLTSNPSGLPTTISDADGNSAFIVQSDGSITAPDAQLENVTAGIGVAASPYPASPSDTVRVLAGTIEFTPTAGPSITTFSIQDTVNSGDVTTFGPSVIEIDSTLGITSALLTIEVIPEPAVATLLGLGTLLCLSRRRARI